MNRKQLIELTCGNFLDKGFHILNSHWRQLRDNTSGVFKGAFLLHTGDSHWRQLRDNTSGVFKGAFLLHTGATLGHWPPPNEVRFDFGRATCGLSLLSVSALPLGFFRVLRSVLFPFENPTIQNFNSTRTEKTS